MLDDGEIVSLRTDRQYEKAIRVGLKSVATDLVGKGQAELKPELGTLSKLAYGLIKARVVRQELYSCSAAFLERLLNSELAWPRTPQSVQEICQAERENYLWMRYEEAQVNALLSRCKWLLNDAAFRNVVKSHALRYGADKNAQLVNLRRDVDILHEGTLVSIRARTIFDKMTEMRRDRFYEQNEKLIQQQFLNAERSGNLGLPPPPNDGDRSSDN